MSYICGIDKGSTSRDAYNILIVLENEVLFAKTYPSEEEFNAAMKEVIEEYTPLKIIDFTV